MKILSFKNVVRTGFKNLQDFFSGKYPPKEDIRGYITCKKWTPKTSKKLRIK